MAFTWGSISGKMRLGLNIYTQSDGDLVCSVYVGNDSAGYDWTASDTISVSLNGPGSYDGSWSPKPYLTSSYDEQYIGQVIIPASALTMGSTYTFSVSASGLHTGGSPSHSDTYTIPDIGSASTPTVSAITSSEATVNWSLPANAKSIQIQVDNSSGFGSPHSQYRDASSPSYPFTGPSTVSTGYIGAAGSPYGTYYTRIRGYNSDYGEYGPWSGTRTFQLLANKPNAPSTPSAGSIDHDSAVISWSDPSNWGGNNTSDFDLQVDNNSNFSSPIFSGEVNNANSKTITGLAHLTTYYARVRARNAAGDGSWSATKSFKTLADFPSKAGTPVLTPLTHGEGFTAAWNDPSDWGGNNSSTFDLQFSPSSSFSGAATETVSGNSKTIQGVTPGLRYYVRVRAKNSRGVGDWSNSAYVDMYDYPDPPQDVVITDITPTSISFDWNAPPVDGGRPVTSYTVQVADNASFTNTGQASATATEYTTVNKEPNTTYYFRVRANNSVGYSEWSTVVSGETLAAAYIKKGGAWKSVVQVFIKKGGVWKPVEETFVKKGGVWKS